MGCNIRTCTSHAALIHEVARADSHLLVNTLLHAVHQWCRAAEGRDIGQQRQEQPDLLKPIWDYASQ